MAGKPRASKDLSVRQVRDWLRRIQTEKSMPQLPAMSHYRSSQPDPVIWHLNAGLAASLLRQRWMRQCILTVGQASQQPICPQASSPPLADLLVPTSPVPGLRHNTFAATCAHDLVCHVGSRNQCPNPIQLGQHMYRQHHHSRLHVQDAYCHMGSKRQYWQPPSSQSPCSRGALAAAKP